MSQVDILLQQCIIGLSNGMIIALIALGYTMVYGILELINFAHGDVFMLGGFLTLTVIGALGISVTGGNSMLVIPLLILCSALFCALVNVIVNRLAYRPLRGAPRLAPLVAAIGVSFILINIGLFWGGLPLEVFSWGTSAAAPKSVPSLLSEQNILGSQSMVQYSWKEFFVCIVTVPTLLFLTWLVKRTTFGRAMRAVAEDPVTASLMGIHTERIISLTFALGGALAGIASTVYVLYNNSVYFLMGFRVGMDAFIAAVVGGIGNLLGAVCGGLLIGLVRAFSDQFLSTQWTNVVVFSLLITVTCISTIRAARGAGSGESLRL